MNLWSTHSLLMCNVAQCNTVRVNFQLYTRPIHNQLKSLIAGMIRTMMASTTLLETIIFSGNYALQELLSWMGNLASIGLGNISSDN